MLRKILGLRSGRPLLRFKKAVPSPLDMRDGTRVRYWCSAEKRFIAGTFRGAAPDGSYAVMPDIHPGTLVACMDVELEDVSRRGFMAAIRQDAWG